MNTKKAALLNKTLVEIVVIGLIFALFVFVNAGKVNGRGVKQDILERQIALMLDASSPGMTFSLEKVQENGVINNVEVKNGRVYVTVDGYVSRKGYPFFSPHEVFVSSKGDLFLLEVKDE